MPKITFHPDNKTVEVEPNTKLLVAARRNKVDIRFGCASGRCGLCAVKITSNNNTLVQMKVDERDLLTKLKLSTTGDVRLSCQARATETDISVDLEFQESYTPNFD